jgi:hypothetical protein
MAIQTYPDGFPKSPQEAIEFSYFLSESEKQEWRDWLSTATPEQENELIDILHSMWQDNQKSAVPESFNNSPAPAAPQEQKPNQNFQPTNQPSPQSFQPTNSPANDPFGAQSQINSFNPGLQNNFDPNYSNPQTNYQDYDSLNKPVQAFNPAPQPQQQPQNNNNNNFNQNPSADQNLNNNFPPFPSNQQQNPQFQQQPFNQNNQFNSQQNPNKTANPAGQQSTNLNSFNPTPNQAQSFGQPLNNPTPQQQSSSTNLNFEAEDILSFPAQPIPTPEVSTKPAEPPQPVEPPKPAVKEPEPIPSAPAPAPKPVAKDEPVAKPKSPVKEDMNIENLVKDNKYRPNPLLQNDPEETKSDFNYRNPTEVDQKPQNNFNKNKPNNNPATQQSKNNTAKKSGGVVKFNNLKDDGSSELLEEIYGDYMQTYDTNQKKLMSFMERITKVISNYETLTGHFKEMTEKHLEMNSQIVHQAQDIQSLENSTASQSGKSLQEQIDDIKYELESQGGSLRALEREMRTVKTENRRRIDELSQHVAGLGADKYGEEGVLQKIELLRSEIEDLKNNHKNLSILKKDTASSQSIPTKKSNLDLTGII